MSGKFQPIQIPPGVVTQPTKSMRSSNWAEVNLVRWIEGELQPVGGQAQIHWTVDPTNPIVGGYGDGDYSAGDYGEATTLKIVSSFASRCKMIHGWFDLSGNHHVAYVCERNVYVDFNTAGTLYEITPASGWPAPPLPAQGGYGDLNYGQDLPVAAPTTAYGTPRASGVIEPLDKIPNMWSVDNFGAILLVMASTTGELLQWDPAASAGTLLTRVTSSSTGTGFAPKGRCFVVTPERFVVIFGMYADGTTAPDTLGRRFGWCDQENPTAWDFTNVTSQAGFLDIEPASPIITAISGRFGTLFFTSQKAYVSKFIGLPYVYNYVELADNACPWSPASIVTTSSQMLWMSAQGAFSFDGNTITPVQCLVRPWITDDHDPLNVREQACAVHLGDFSEFWWFFPQNGQPYNTRCIIYNYKEGWWSQGRMSRSAGITSSYTSEPILADGLLVFRHEMVGVPQYANADPPFAETFDLNLTSGAQLVTLKQVIPDVKGNMPNVAFQFYTRMSRSIGAAGQWSDPIPLARRPDGYVDVRVTGRGIRMKIACLGPTITPFTLGQHLVDFAVRGDR